MLKLATVLFCLLLSAGAAAAGRIGGITTYNDPVLDEIVTRAEDGDVSAMTELGDQFRLGTETRKPDLARALECRPERHQRRLFLWSPADKPRQGRRPGSCP
jgi:hypothetical protein